MEKRSERAFDFEHSEIKKVYTLLSVHAPERLYGRFLDEDQQCMQGGTWNYDDPKLVINKVKNMLEAADPAELTPEEADARQEILWLWNHHATSRALFHKDKEKARMFSAHALGYQSEGNANKITGLLDLLANDKPEEAEKWAEVIDDETEKETAARLIQEYHDALSI